ncbi:peptidoglycan editing factor PgeF [Radiobacillus sp. PE A8.2]|uniref:peptidoglycan editing factor PgeF n=1 Tax=Radiobacillus sp. PE A8.2 TaxID=3380349 RepID=UPI003890D74C
MKEPFQSMNQSVLKIDQWMEENDGLVAGITTRQGGVSDEPFSSFNLGFHVPDIKKNVRKNREILGEILGYSLNEWMMGEQVHKTNVAVVNSSHKSKGAFKHGDALSGYDGLITNDRGLLLTSLFADCVPLYFLDPTSQWIGIAHAGWRGTVNGMAANMVKELEKQTVLPSNLKVVVGPSISGSKYEVDDQVIDNIPEQYHKHSIVMKDNGRYLLDLRKLNYSILVESGVMPENINITSYCTYSNPDLFFSHRRDQGKTGRMLGFIGVSAQT